MFLLAAIWFEFNDIILLENIMWKIWKEKKPQKEQVLEKVVTLGIVCKVNFFWLPMQTKGKNCPFENCERTVWFSY